MKKLLLLSICTLFIFTSCKKNTSPTPESSISASIDGVKETFNINATANRNYIEGTGNVLIIGGKETSESGSDIINIEVNSTAAITKGSYSIKTGVPEGFDPAIYVSYVQGLIFFYHAVNPASSNLITITDISSTNVQGTFNVALSGSLPSTAPVIINKVITNGEFNIRIE